MPYLWACLIYGTGRDGIPSRKLGMPLTYVAGCAVFSYMKKANKCTNCYNFLTTDKQMENLNDVGSQYILVDLLDRSSLMFHHLPLLIV